MPPYVKYNYFGETILTVLKCFGKKSKRERENERERICIAFFMKSNHPGREMAIVMIRDSST